MLVVEESIIFVPLEFSQYKADNWVSEIVILSKVLLSDELKIPIASSALLLIVPLVMVLFTDDEENFIPSSAELSMVLLNHKLAFYFFF